MHSRDENANMDEYIGRRQDNKWFIRDSTIETGRVFFSIKRCMQKEKNPKDNWLDITRNWSV